ncbi:MAG: hypothetical protein LQ347_006928 [Umbilicaria vellea]|nr:MAG: hypothetical protein LQ347_006928 [Umbilicaria vellea]
MASFQGINVKVISDGVTLTCYDDPDETTIRKSGEVRKYIEAVTDAKFMVAFQLTEGFDMGHCDEDAADVGTSRELLKDLGSIKLCVQRVMRRERPVPYDYKDCKKARDTIESVPENLLKGQAISNKVK